MHFDFIPYGKRSEVELLLRDMEAQKHELIMTKGEEKKSIWIQGQVRQLPFGVMEYICPKEDMDTVLHTLDANSTPYLSATKLKIIRKMLGCKEIPEFKKDFYYKWIKTFVSIIPVGIKEDGEVTGVLEHDNGWTHEAI